MLWKLPWNFRKDEENELIQKNKARDTDIKQTVAQNKELEKKLAKISVDSIYSSGLVDSYQQKVEEKIKVKASVDDFRTTGFSSEAEEPLLNNPRPSYCCKRCGIF